MLFYQLLNQILTRFVAGLCQYKEDKIEAQISVFNSDTENSKNKNMRSNILIFLVVVFSAINFTIAHAVTQVGLYRTFERTLENNNTYSNKFKDVELTCTFTSPSGKVIDFYGFFDGDGAGGGDMQTGNIC